MPATESARSINARNFYRLFNESGYNEYLDDLILSQSRHRQLKVALIFARVMQKCEVEGRIVSGEKLNERLRNLIEAGELEAFGDISNWRFSEVQLKTQAPKSKTAE